MGLVPSITVVQSRNGQVLDVTDTTGTYDRVSNQDGYGAARTAGTITLLNDVFTLAAHGMQNGTVINLINIGGTTNTSLDVLYYIVSSTVNTFQIAAIEGGTPVVTGSTVGAFDFTVGFRTAASTARTRFIVNIYKTDEDRIVDLTTPPFIPQVTTDTTSLNSTAINATTGVITDGVYTITMIPLWNTSKQIDRLSANIFQVAGADLSGLYAGYGYILVNDSGTITQYTVTAIEFTGGNTNFTVADTIPASPASFVAANWFIGLGASYQYYAYHNLLVCTQKEGSKINTNDIVNSCRGGATSPHFQKANTLMVGLQAIMFQMTCGMLEDAQECGESLMKMCDNCNCNCDCDDNCCS